MPYLSNGSSSAQQSNSLSSRIVQPSNTLHGHPPGQPNGGHIAQQLGNSLQNRFNNSNAAYNNQINPPLSTITSSSVPYLTNGSSSAQQSNSLSSQIVQPSNTLHGHPTGQPNGNHIAHHLGDSMQTQSNNLNAIYDGQVNHLLHFNTPAHLPNRSLGYQQSNYPSSQTFQPDQQNEFQNFQLQSNTYSQQRFAMSSNPTIQSPSQSVLLNGSLSIRQSNNLNQLQFGLPNGVPNAQLPNTEQGQQFTTSSNQMSQQQDSNQTVRQATSDAHQVLEDLPINSSNSMNSNFNPPSSSPTESIQVRRIQIQNGQLDRRRTTNPPAPAATRKKSDDDQLKSNLRLLPDLVPTKLIADRYTDQTIQGMVLNVVDFLAGRDPQNNEYPPHNLTDRSCDLYPTCFDKGLVAGMIYSQNPRMFDFIAPTKLGKKINNKFKNVRTTLKKQARRIAADRAANTRRGSQENGCVIS